MENGSDVLQAEEAAKIAEAQLKQSTADVKRHLLEKGYQTQEEALADVKKKQDEADKLLELARKEATELAEQKEAYETEKQKLLNAYKIFKEKEATVTAKLEQAVKLEENSKADANNHQALTEELMALAVYHKSHITPCRKALLQVSRAIYGWADQLQQGNVDYIPLYNYIGKAMTIIDRFIDKTSAGQPNDKREGGK